MFTKHQLEWLAIAIEHIDPLAPITGDQIRELRGAIASAHWIITKDLSRADKKRIVDAEAAGKVQVFTHVANVAATPGGWTMASRIAESRKVDPIHKAADGDSLLAALGLGAKAS